MTKQTKIVATISDLKCETEFLEKLIENGVNLFRLNTAHQSEADTLKTIKNIRKVTNKIPIMVDTKGPEIRTTPCDEPIQVKRGDKIKFSGNPNKKTTKDLIYVNTKLFVKEIPVNSSLLYDDGEIEFKVIKKTKDYLLCEVKNPGIIKGKKSINVPNVHISLPSLTKKDRAYVEFSIKHNVDFIAHSFIRNKHDLLEVQKILDKKKSKIKLIAKIENKEGVDNIEEILDNCYGIMVARGDLAIEIPAEKVPAIQKQLIKTSIEKRKVVITATQMLHTMIKNPRPTRAEVSDIANAIYDGTDAIMLSGETAYGEYPVSAVKVMNKVAMEVEKNLPSIREDKIKTTLDDIPKFLAKSTIRSCAKLPVKAIVTDTLTGRTARYLSAYRGKSPIYALTYSEKVMRELALSYGVYADYVKKINKDILISNKLKYLIKNKFIKEKDMISVLTGSFGPTHGASKLEVSYAKNLIK